MESNESGSGVTEAALMDSVASAELVKLGKNVAQLSLDQLIGDELLDQIPIIGAIAKGYKSIVTISDRLFLLKVLALLEPLAGVPRDGRQKFVDDLSRHAGSRVRAGAALALALERLDDLEKPKILGRLCLAKMRDKISVAQFWRYCMIVDRGHLPDLIDLSKLGPSEQVNPLAAPYLHALGVVALTGEDFGTFDGIGAKEWYEVNEMGRAFLSVAFTE